MAGLRGVAAQRAVRAVLEAVGPLLPPGLELEIVGSPRAWRLGVRRPAGERRGVWDITRKQSGDLHIEASNVVLFGIGSWIPDLPDRLNTKLNASSALETVQEAVSEATGAPWPGPDYDVHSSVGDSSVRIWFERKTDAHRIELPVLARTLFRQVT